MENSKYFVFTVNNRRAALMPETDKHVIQLQAMVAGFASMEEVHRDPNLWICSNDDGFSLNLEPNVLLPAYRGDIVLACGGGEILGSAPLHGFPGPVAFALVNACNTWIRDGKIPAIVEDICVILAK